MTIRGRVASAAAVVAVCAAAGAAVGGVATALWPPRYDATTRVMLATPEWNDSSAVPSAQAASSASSYGDEFTQQRMATYLELATSTTVLGPAASTVGLSGAPALSGAVTVRLVPDTVMLDVRAEDGDPQRAADIANAVARRFAAVVRDVERPTADAIAPVQPVVVTPATAAARAVSPDPAVLLTTGAAIGAAAGLTIAVSRRRGLAARWAGGTQVVETSGAELPVLGSVPGDTPVVFDACPVVLGDAAQAVRATRAKVLTAAREHGAHVLAVTAPTADVSASGAAALLAAAVSETARSAAVIDASGLVASWGGEELSAAGGAHADLELGCCGRVGAYRVPPADAGRIAVGGAEVGAVIERAARRFDLVLVVTEPWDSGPGAVDVLAHAQAHVLVAVADTDPRDLDAAATGLAADHATLLGVVIADRPADSPHTSFVRTETPR
ncbi:hypothetical protein P0W64_01485 [Tsukamurella sp. 8F]|uniref:YveK family protein n=1 Tax=unclassified Tsukamurella TaxID=2633480 RepID=UPI0023B91673|nr:MULTISPECIES: hypothetical protein [unclassified Tsukamurella]MDF0531090.1 hypothetical protein [Tsukamurella sp. 8J]MDF0585443.1 hypothetical protein [Tsukamurella sp. 8F]